MMDELDDLNDLEKAQIILQMYMKRYSCDADKAKDIIKNATAFPLGMISAIDMMFPPTFSEVN